MDASLLFSRGNALHAVDAALVLELGKDAVAFDNGDNLFQAAGGGVGRRKDFDLPALGFGIARVHTEDFGGEESGFVSAGSSADFENDVLFVVRVFGKQQDF